MSDRVREPIQVYLNERERAQLERIARELGVSRSEVLRRGIGSIASGRRPGPLDPLVAEGLVTSPLSPAAGPPQALPAFPLAEVLDGLGSDRGDR